MAAAVDGQGRITLFRDSPALGGLWVGGMAAESALECQTLETSRVSHPCVTFPAALEFVCSPVNKTLPFLLHSVWLWFFQEGEPFSALLHLLGREMGWEQGVLV